MKTQIHSKANTVAQIPPIPGFKLYKNQVYRRSEQRNAIKQRANSNCIKNSEDSAFSKLDENDEVQAKRIQQRRKQVSMGKNTAGYELYLEKIPKAHRKSRSMETPSTPDHTLDIPAKRWAGIVRSWRVALHRYDPDELVTKMISNDDNTALNSNVVSAEKSLDERNHLMQEFEAQGLLVDCDALISNDGSPQAEMTSTFDFTDDKQMTLEDDFDGDSDDDLL